MSKYSEIKNKVKQNGTTTKYQQIKEKIKSGGYTYDLGMDAEEYIKSFVTDANSFITSAQTDYESIGWGNASSVYDSRYKTYSDLNQRGENYRIWLALNKSNLGDETYKSYIKDLDYILSTTSSVMDDFTDVKEHYSQWKTEEDYNKAVEAQKEYEGMMSFNLEAGKKEIEELEKAKTALEWTKKSLSELKSETDALELSLKKVYNKDDEAKLKANKERIATTEKNLEEALAKYGGESGLNALLSEKNQYYTLASRVQSAEKIKTDAINNPDFDKYAKAMPLTQEEWLSNWDKNIEDAAVGEYEDGVKKYLAENNLQYRALKYMQPDEYKIYSYYFMMDAKNARDNGTENTQELSNKYLESIEETLNARLGGYMYSRVEDNWFLEYCFKAKAIAEGYGNKIKNFFSTEDYIPVTATEYAVSMMREDLYDNGPKLPDWLGGASLGQVGFDLVGTVTEMIPTMIVSQVPVVGTALGAASIGLSSAGGKKTEMLREGYSQEEATTTGVLTGIAEAGLQYAIGGISSLGGKLSGNAVSNVTSKVSNGVARAAIKIGGNMASEGLEESLQTILEPYFKSIATGQDVEDIDWEEVAYSGLLGMATAGLLEGPSTVVGEVSTYNAGKKIKADTEALNRLTKLGSTMSADSVAYKLAGKIDENTGAYTIGRLLNEVGASLSEANMSDIVKSLERKGMRTEDAQVIAKWINNAVEGKKLSKKQIEALESNDVAAKTLNDVLLNNNSTVLQRVNGYNELRKFTKSKASAKNSTTQATEATPVTENTTAEETATETKFAVSESGKTTLNGNEVSIKDIASIKDGEVMLLLDNGETVNARDVEFSNEDEGLIYEAVANMDVDRARDFVQGFTASKNAPLATPQTAQSYVLGFNEAYGYGRYGIPESVLERDGKYSKSLSGGQKKIAYNRGAIDARSQVTAKQEAINEKVKKATESPNKTKAKGGRVSFESGVKATTANEKKAVRLAKYLSSAIGIDIVFYDARTTSDPNGKGTNGYFDVDTNTIHLDLQKADNDTKTIAFTLSHEISHFIKEWSPEKFDTLAKFLIEQYSEHGVDVSTMLANKMAELDTDNRDLAYEEMICDALETMLLDSNAMVKLMELKQTDLSLFEKLKMHILELLNKLREAYRNLGYETTTDEAKALLKMTDVLEKLHSMFEDAAVDATQSFQAVQNSNETVFGEASFDMGKTESGVKHQLKAHKTIGENALTYNERHKNVHNAVLQVGVETMYEMAEAMLPYLEEEGILPPDIPGKTIFKNGSYGKTGENTTLCVRTLTYEDFKDRVAENIGRPLTVSESLLVSQKIYDIATEPQCIYCYVAADRKAYDEYLGEYHKAMDKYIKAMRNGGDSQALYTEYLAGRKDTNQQKKRWSMWESIAKSGKEYISAKDLTTKRKRDGIIAKKNAFSEQIKDAQRYAQSASWAKTVFDYRAYNGEILKMTSKFVDMLNSEYGLRMYSFSDYTPAFIVENMQMILDASVKGLKSLAYTKDTDYAEIFASTGQAINISCFAKWDAESGTYVEDNRQGANWEKTKSLRKQYRNVGAVMVATNDAMVEWALKQDWIDVVIPYHIVKTGTTIANEYQWNNYTSESSDKIGNKGANIYPTEHNNDFATYSNLLNERGITPRFSRWYDKVASGELTEAQYMKLVNEVRLPASELSPVVPSFNLEAAKKSFGIDNDGKVIKGGFVDKGGYMGGWYRQGVDVNQEVMAVSEDIKAGKSSLDVDYGMSKSAKEKVEQRYEGIKKQAKKKPSHEAIEDDVKKFATEINQWVKDGRQEGVTFILGSTGDVLQGLGAIESDIYILGDKIKTILNEHPEISIADIKKIPQIVGDPVLILKSRNVGRKSKANSRLVIFGNVKASNGNQILSVLDLKPVEKGLVIDDMQKVNSVYTKTDPASFVSNSDVVYADEKRTTLLLRAIGFQTPIALQQSGYIGSISYYRDIVNIHGKTFSEVVTTNGIKKQLKKTPSTYAPTFYSQMGKVIDDIKMDKIGATSIVNYLKGKGIKHDEIKWSGIEAWLEGKKSVTKAELQEFVAGSQLVIEEEMSGGDIDLRYDGSNRAYNLYDSTGNIIDTFTYNEFMGGYIAESDEEIYSNGIELTEALREEYGIVSAPKWADYKLHGGTNYRELVFKMPDSSYSNRAMRGHWGQDAEGILVHARIQDFDVNGKKMLFIEELQSDWHNEGMEKGYSTEEYEDAVAVYNKLADDYTKKRQAFNKYVRSSEFRSDPDEVSKKKFDWLRSKMDTAEKRMQDAERDIDALKKKGMGDVPDAPFRDTYHEYVLKRLLRMAAEEGYDSIGWTPADIQSKRWSYDYEKAYKIEYDQEMPKFLRKYGKKWGATVGKERVGGFDEKVDVDINTSPDDDVWLLADGVSFEGTEVWSMDITEPMEQSVLYEGQAKFQKKKLSNRTILSNALESSIDTSTQEGQNELRWLKEYQDKINLIEKEEAHLAEVNAEIKEISFTKGSDRSKLNELNADKNRTANRITTFDKQLMRLETMKPIKDVLAREKEMVRKRTEQKGKEAMAKLREREAEKTRILLNRASESRKKGIESRSKTKMRGKIRSLIKDLKHLLNHGTKERNVKEEMKETVASAMTLAEVLFNDEIRNEDIVRLGVDSVTPEESQLLNEYNVILDQIEAVDDQIEALDKEERPKEERFKLRDDLEQTKGKLKNKLSTLNKKLADVFVRERARLNKAQVSEVMDTLINNYASLKGSDNDYIKNAHSAEMEEWLKTLKKDLGGTLVRDMSIEQLQSVYDAFKMVQHMVRTSNSLFREGRTEDLMTIVSAVQEEIFKLYKSKNDPISAIEDKKNIINTFSWNNLKPVYAFDRLGSATFQNLYWDAVEADNDFARLVTEAGEFLQKQRAAQGYANWDLSKATEFKLADGKVFKLTLEDMMSIYAYSKREQAYDHMTEGGFVFDENNTYSDKPFDGKKFIGNLRIKKKHAKLTETYRVDLQLIGKVINSLSAEQKAYVDAMQKFMTDMGQKGNEISRTLYGIDLFTEEHYIPLQSSKDYLNSNKQALDNAQTQVSLKNNGTTKPTAPKANNPIVLRAFDELWLEHIDTMSKYCSYVLPIENLTRVFNNVSKIEGQSPMSTQALISAVYGNGARAYFDQYITDLNGGNSIGGYKSPLMAMFSKFKATSVGASLSVIVQQPFAIIRAMAMIRPDYFIPFLRGQKNSKDFDSTWEEIKKYAPIAILKEMGGFDIGSAGTTKDYIGITDYQGAKGKLKGLAKDSKYRKKSFDDAVMYGATKADEIGWGIIWKAVKKEVATEQKLTPGTEEFMEAVGKRFTEVVVRTQVYDSVNSRSGIMRSKNDLNKFATSFMGEPTTTINMLYIAGLNVVRAIKSKDMAQIAQSGKHIARTMGVVVASIVLTSLFKSAIYANRDDEEDESWTERWMRNFGDSLSSDLNPLTMIPYLRDLVSIYEGWDVERPDMTLFANIITSAKRFLDDGATEEEILALCGDIANMFGIPAKNVVRDVKGIINLIGDHFDDIETTDAGGAFDRGWEGEEQSKTDALYEAIINGDSGKIEYYKSSYKSKSAYISALRTALTDNDPRIQEAVMANIEGDAKKRVSIVLEIKGEGNFSQDDIVVAVNNATTNFNTKVKEAITAKANGKTEEHDKIVKELLEKYPKEFVEKMLGETILEEEEDTPDKVIGLYDVDDYYTSVINGDMDTAYSAKEDIIKTAIANGKDRDEAEKSFISSFVSHLGELYEDGELSDYEAQNMLINYGGKSTEEAYSKVQYWAFKQDYPDIDLSESAVTKYYEEIEPYGISINVYYDYSKQAAKCKGTDSNGDGKADSGTKKAEIMQVINSLPISSYQKDAIYLANGWARSTLWQAPWH